MTIRVSPANEIRQNPETPGENYQSVAMALAKAAPARSIGGMLFECALCPAITMLMLVGLVGVLLVARIRPV